VKPEVLIDKLEQHFHDHVAALREPVPAPSPEEEVLEPVDEDPAFNVDELAERYAGRPDDLWTAIRLFERNSIDCLGRLRSCLAAGYEDRAKDLLRSFREATALVSSERLLELALHLDALVEDRLFPEAQGAFDELRDQLDRCRELLPEALARATYE
jgi:hypothetical protein